MTELITVEQTVEIARAFSHGVPVPAHPVEMASDQNLDLNFILTFDDNTFPINLPYPRLAIFDKKGAQLVSITFTPGVTNWPLERPQSGRIGWHIPGDHTGFDVITSLHPQELQYRILGLFNAQREITILQGNLQYTKLADNSPPEPPPESEELNSELEMELQFKSQYPHYYTEYTWNGTTGDLDYKRHYDTPAKVVLLFTIAYEWSNMTGLLSKKTITRASDNKQLILNYAWDVDEELESVTRTAV
jgi:hypothetical protein